MAVAVNEFLGRVSRMRFWCFALMMLLTIGAGASPSPAAAQSGSLPAPARPLATPAGSWVIELTKVQGLGLITDRVVVSSTGETICGGRAQCDNDRYKGVLNELDTLVRSKTAPEPWSDKRLLLCNDCPTTTVTIRRRKGDGRTSMASYRWTSRSKDELPAFLKGVHSAFEAAAGR